MSRIDDLISKLAPDGVELRAIGEVGSFKRGGGPQKKDFVHEGVGCIHYGQIYTHYGVHASETKVFVADDVAEKSRKAEPGDVIIAVTGENDDDLARGVAWLGESAVAVSNHTLIFSSGLDPKYFSYFLRSRSFDEQKRRYIMGTKVRSISAQSFDRIRIPVPPLDVQREIVQILDHFSELEAELEEELEAELEARRLQHAHYRDSLLTLRESGEVRWATIGEVAEFKYGFTASAADSGEYRFIRITDIDPVGKLRPDGAKYVASSAAGREYTVSRGDLLMARTGATYGKTVLVESDEPAIYASFLIRIRFSSNQVLPSYYWHFAQSGLYWSQANAMVSTGGQPQFNANSLKRVKLAVPPLEEQERIVSILDKLDALVNDLSMSLPAELAARRKQYEYYRDRLLTFKELVA